jgi:hypothetical protein
MTIAARKSLHAFNTRTPFTAEQESVCWVESEDNLRAPKGVLWGVGMSLLLFWLPAVFVWWIA